MRGSTRVILKICATVRGACARRSSACGCRRTWRCFASLFTDRAISYRADKGFDHEKIALSVGVQRMVRSDLAASGVMFTLDTESGFRDAVLINAAYGLGENVVQGSVNPDEYYVFKPTLLRGHASILQKVCGTKEFKLPFDVQRVDLKVIARPRTKVMMNLANPEEAFALSFIPNDGVGIAPGCSSAKVTTWKKRLHSGWPGTIHFAGPMRRASARVSGKAGMCAR